MARAKSPLRLEAERLCQSMPSAASKTLARRLADEFACTIEEARSTVRVVRGAKGADCRKKSSGQVARKGDPEAAKTPKVPPTQLPESKAEQWEPFELSPNRALILSDTHIPYHDAPALNAAIKHGISIEPDVVILNGDIADFYSISRHQKDPRKRNFKAELASVRQFLQYMRETFADARIVYKYGNHEERYEHWVWNHAPEICDLEEVQLHAILKLDSMGIEWVSDKRPVMCGLLPVFHGHELGRSGIANPVNPARGAFLRTHHTVLVGHSHQTSGHADTDVWHDETYVWSTGCLCHLNPEWNPINRWNHGFAGVECYDDGFSVENFRVSKSGKVRKS